MKNDGGPAFPRQLKQVDNPDAHDFEALQAQKGMSVRTWLVGQAISGLAAAEMYSVIMAFSQDNKLPSKEHWKTLVESVVGTAEMIADEHLRRLAEEKSGQ